MKMSTGVAAMKMPDNPPMMNIETNAQAKSMAVVKWILPPHIVPSQLNVLIGVGSAIIIVETMNAMPRAGFMPEHEHVMSPDDEAQARDARDRVDHRLVAEQRLAGEAGRGCPRPFPSPEGS